eukprot:bmy_19982T0
MHWLKFQALKPKLLDMMDDMLNRRLGHDYEGPGEDTDDVEWVVDKEKPTCNEIYILSPFSSQIMSTNAK